MAARFVEKKSEKNEKENKDLEEGYDVKFVDENVETEDISCVICLHILREPMQAVPCGHRFCKFCIEKMKEKE